MLSSDPLATHHNSPSPNAPAINFTATDCNNTASPASSLIHIAHINICSLRNKVNDLHKILFNAHTHILSVNETHLDSTFSDASVHIPGYAFYRRDRNRNGGGVGFYVKNERSPRNQLLVGTVYRPPASLVVFWEELSDYVDQLPAVVERVVIMGDFNVDVLRTSSSPQYRHFENFTSEFCLTNVIREPTRFPSQTCLDLALVSSRCLPCTPKVTPTEGLTDHYLVELSINVPNFSLPTGTQVRLIRKPALHRVDKGQCDLDLQRTLQATADSVHDKDLDIWADGLTRAIGDVMERHAPVKRVVVAACSKPKPQPWLTSKLLHLLRQRTHLHRKVLRHPEDAQLKAQYRDSEK